MTKVSRQGRLAQVVDSDRFNGLIASVILANAVVLGLETYPGVVESHGSTLVKLNGAFYLVFVTELILRLASYGRRPQDFFRSGWNVFDLVIIGSVAIPAVREQAQLMRILRLARIARLVRFLPDARILVLTVVKSIPSVFSMVVLTLVLMFVYGMVGWAVFGEALPESWGTIGQAMLTLFILLTLENFPTYLSDAEQVSPYAPLFFVSYILLAAFIVFNLLIGIVIGSMEKARQHEAKSSRTDAEDDSFSESTLLDRIALVQASLSEIEDDLRRREQR
ncbi:MAG: ion transporter [Actinomycetia bacterium]|nr:ion transporter [Actinomycetes bacterium]